jgi:cob(I)alamin adenosyltransferase
MPRMARHNGEAGDTCFVSARDTRRVRRCPATVGTVGNRSLTGCMPHLRSTAYRSSQVARLCCAPYHLAEGGRSGAFSCCRDELVPFLPDQAARSGFFYVERTTMNGLHEIASAQTSKGLVIVNTGYGKGKTTAALGMLLRAWGQRMRVCVIQFIKDENGNSGEMKAAQQLGIEWHTMGDGFTWQSRDVEATKARACDAWALARTKIVSGDYDLVILDEFTYLVQFRWLDAADVIAWLRENKPPSLHLVITGWGASRELVQYADLVTEMQKVKHPFDEGILGQPGVEF